MAVKKISVLGLGKAGVTLSAVIALKCPEIRVTVVKSNHEEIFQWNTGKIPQSVPGLDELLRKCQNRNLVFTTNEALAINEADIIFVLSESILKHRGEGEDQAVDLSVIEEAAYLIAEHAESSKIVVENSFIPLRTAECMRNVFRYNCKPGVEVQVVSNPEFYEQGSPLRHLLFPDCVLIGSDSTADGLAAAKLLVSIYERWVPPEKIITRTNWLVELSKIATSAMAAQELGSIYAVSSICEESGADISPFLSLLRNCWHLEFNSGVGKFPTVLHNLVYMCECIGLREVADYWRQVLVMFTLHRDRFLKQFVWTLTQAWNKKIALMGFAYYRDTEVVEGSAAVDLCKSFVEENASVSVYDPRVTKSQVIRELKWAGCRASEETMTKAVTVHEDPYKAAYQAQVIISCGIWPELTELDYSRIYAEMTKPAYIFDRGHSLPHAKLSEIGFMVYTVGRSTKNHNLV